ncbi:hypothetical protein ACIRP0_04970 [Streptomyces sp. NPDC101733]|uniref:hypothetical protein n=1 Tax=unclassified Streptomyces TaxID=2593676 RepID=UPI0037F899E0
MWWRSKRRADDPLAEVVARLHIPIPFDLRQFCEAVAADRGRPLVLQELDGANPDVPCGIWVSLDEADLVFYQPAASTILRRQIILHEVSHMLLGHVGPHYDLAGTPRDDDLAAASTSLRALTTPAEQFGGPAARGDDTGDASEPEVPVAAFMRAEAARIRAAVSATTRLDEETGVSPDTMFALLGRTKYSGPQEADAENLATLIHEKASRTEARSRTAKGADVVERLSDAFGHPTE